MKGKVKKLVSFGGPMMGTSQVPYCLEGVTCYIVNSLVDFIVYNKNIQKNIGPSAYYRTAAHINNYIESNSLLVKLNNTSQKEKQNFIGLESLVLIGFEKDKMISPKESAEFGIFDEHFNILKMNETEEYKNDVFGLKSLDKAKKIKIFYIKDEHNAWDLPEYLKYAKPYL